MSTDALWRIVSENVSFDPVDVFLADLLPRFAGPVGWSVEGAAVRVRERVVGEFVAGAGGDVLVAEEWLSGVPVGGLDGVVRLICVQFAELVVVACSPLTFVHEFVWPVRG